MNAGLKAEAIRTWGTARAVIASIMLIAGSQAGFVQSADDVFTTKVLPILKSRCYECHSHEAKKSRGGLMLDSRASLREGGSSGPAIVAGAPDKSLLIQAVRRSDPDFAMPPQNALPESEVRILEQWVKQGAHDPRTPAPLLPGAWDDIQVRAKTHWALQPVKKSTPPSADTTWRRNTIDDFISQKLREHDMRPAADAKPRDLARRLTFNLIGLPPTLERVRAFERAYAANADAAVADLVEELLASPHHGERWGRHWLDLARYADESGGVSNRARETRLLFAFTYRDYVIRAFNQDRPYNQFILEQLAGDQITLNDPRDQAAMGFLAIGSLQGSPAEVRAERIDTVGKVFMGLTLGCARCHDHKFDPISAEDYYAIEGVFQSTQEVGVPRPFDPVGDFEACPIIEESADPKRRAEREQAIAKAEKAVADYEEQFWGPVEPQWRILTPKVLRTLVMDRTEFGALGQRDYLRKNDIPDVLFASWSKWLADEKRQIRKGVHPVFGVWFELEELPAEGFATAAAEVLARYGGVNRYVLEALRARPLGSMRDVADAYSALFMQFARETQVLPDPEREALRQVLHGAGSPPSRDPTRWRNAFGNLPDKKRNELLAKVSDARFTHPGAPARAMVLRDLPPRDAFLLIRGEADQRGDRVPRGFLSVLGPGGKRIPFSRTQSGRLELAQAIVHPSNPLTARVLVNRVWAMHFGRPLVETVDNFGLQTPEPEHLALLDWLAATFMEDGWSLKALHRRILLSRVYRQSAVEHSAFVQHTAIDPDNKRHWRANVRRLDFESLRDGVLATCGVLDRTLYGRSVDIIGDVGNRRRTVYAFLDRPLQPLFSAFGVPDNSVTAGERHQAISASQALFLMNSSMIERHAGALLRNKTFVDGTTSERATWVMQRLLQRAPTAREFDSITRFLSGRERDENAWLDIVQALLMSNEFGHTL